MGHHAYGKHRKRAHLDNDDGYGFREAFPMPDTPRKQNYPRVVSKAHEEVVQIGKTPILHPTDGYQEYMATIHPVTVDKAKFELRDENNRPLINFRGDLLYFSKIKEPFEIQATLQERFGIQTTVVYGPGSRKLRGEPVPPPVVKSVKAKA